MTHEFDEWMHQHTSMSKDAICTSFMHIVAAPRTIALWFSCKWMNTADKAASVVWHVSERLATNLQQSKADTICKQTWSVPCVNSAVCWARYFPHMLTRKESKLRLLTAESRSIISEFHNFIRMCNIELLHDRAEGWPYGKRVKAVRACNNALPTCYVVLISIYRLYVPDANGKLLMDSCVPGLSVFQEWSSPLPHRCISFTVVLWSPPMDYHQELQPRLWPIKKKNRSYFQRKHNKRKHKDIIAFALHLGIGQYLCGK